MDAPEPEPKPDGRERRRLKALVEKRAEAEERLTLERWRKLRETPGGGREYAADDPEVSELENQLFRAYVAWKRETAA